MSCNRAVELDAEVCPYCNAPLDTKTSTTPLEPRPGDIGIAIATSHSQRTLFAHLNEVSSMHTQGQRSGYSCSISDKQSIRERAYEIYVQRGAKGGHAEGDWLTAEAELKELKAKAAAVLSTVQSLTKAE